MKKVIAIIAMVMLSLESYSQNTNVYVYDMGKYVPVKINKAEINKILAERSKRDKERVVRIADEGELNDLIWEQTHSISDIETWYDMTVKEHYTQEIIQKAKVSLDSVLAKRQIYLDEWNRKGYNVSGRKRIK